jgi:hypothetical protein
MARPAPRAIDATGATIMPVRKGTNKVHNKKLRRRREGLSTKCYEYGELDGVELALFIRYPKRGEFYSYMSCQQLPWLHDVYSMVLPAPRMCCHR